MAKDKCRRPHAPVSQFLQQCSCSESRCKSRNESCNTKEPEMVDVRKMVYLMILPVVTALACWGVLLLI